MRPPKNRQPGQRHGEPMALLCEAEHGKPRSSTPGDFKAGCPLPNNRRSYSTINLQVKSMLEWLWTYSAAVRDGCWYLCPVKPYRVPSCRAAPNNTTVPPIEAGRDLLAFYPNNRQQHLSHWPHPSSSVAQPTYSPSATVHELREPSTALTGIGLNDFFAKIRGQPSPA